MQRESNVYFYTLYGLFLEREGEGDNMRYKYVLSKNELDGAHKDKSNHFAKDFKVISTISVSVSLSFLPSVGQCL